MKCTMCLAVATTMVSGFPYCAECARILVRGPVAASSAEKAGAAIGEAHIGPLVELIRRRFGRRSLDVARALVARLEKKAKQ